MSYVYKGNSKNKQHLFDLIIALINLVDSRTFSCLLKLQ